MEGAERLLAADEHDSSIEAGHSDLDEAYG
jgi:hypothetical protein